MSFTIISKPEGYQPIYNDLEVIVASDNYTNPKYKFCMDVSINDPTVPFTINLGRFKCYPLYKETTFEYLGYFNLKDVLQSVKQFQTWFNYETSNAGLNINVQMGEEYAASTSGAASYYTTSAFSFVGFNGALPISEDETFDYTDFINTTTTSATSGIAFNYLTSLPSRKVLFSSDLNLDLLNNQTSGNYFVNAYKNNTLLYTTSGNGLRFFSSEIYRRNNFSPSSLGLPSDTTRYTIDIKRANGNNLVPQYAVQIDDTCTKFDKVNVYYQNKYGAEDVFVFTRKSILQSNINRQNYNVSRSLNRGYSQQGTNTYSSNVQRRHTLNTDWLTQSEADALSELVESNNVFISFDKDLQITSGTKGSFRINFTNFVSDGARTLTEAVNLVTPIGNIGFTYTSGGTYDTFADDYINYLITTVLPSSTLATYYDFSASLATSTSAILLCTQKVASTSTNITSSTATNVTISNVVAGTNNNYILPQRIPVTVDMSSHEYKKKVNDNLIQLELTVVEKANYTRQTK